LATIIALILVPTGVAVATELGRQPDLLAAADCPELVAAADQHGLEIAGLMVVECPSGTDLHQALSLLAMLERERSQLGEGEQAIGVLGGSPGERSWSLEGIAGNDEGAQPQP
jgi:hypothetical protein